MILGSLLAHSFVEWFNLRVEPSFNLWGYLDFAEILKGCNATIRNPPYTPAPPGDITGLWP